MMMYQMVCLWCLQVRQCGPCSRVLFVLSLFTFATHFCTASSVHFTSVQSSGNFGSSIFGSGSASDRQPWRHAAGLSHRDSPPARSASSSLTTLISTRRRLHTRTRIQQHALTAARREWHRARCETGAAARMAARTMTLPTPCGPTFSPTPAAQAALFSLSDWLTKITKKTKHEQGAAGRRAA